MAGTFQDLGDYSSDDLTDGEKLFVRTPLLTEEATAAVPSSDDLTAAFVLLTADGRQQLRMHIDGYRASNAVLSGDVTVDQVIKRWGIRNRVRGLLGFDQEPYPTKANEGFGLSSVAVTECGWWDEFRR
jgi:hypothetical protein